ncbi:MAG: glycosyltransferase family 39 protein, partial [Chloroflexota bacterium]
MNNPDQSPGRMLIEKWQWFAGSIILVAIIVRFIAVFVAPVHIDANFYLNIGSNFIERGQVTPHMWRLDDLNIIAGSGTGYAIYLLTGWFQLTELTLLSGRLLMFFIGLLTLPVCYRYVRNFYGHDAGLAAVTFTAVSYMFFWQFNLRMDAFGVLAYSVALLVFSVVYQSTRAWQHAWVGVVAILTAEFHILGTVIVGMFLVYYVSAAIQHWREERRGSALLPLVFYCIGAGITGVIYLVLHVMPDPEAYFFIAREFGPDVTLIEREAARYALFAGFMPVEFVLFLLAIIAAYLRKTEPDRIWLTLAAGYIISQTLIGPPFGLHYTTHIWVIVAPLVGALFANGIRRPMPVKSRRVVAGITLLVIMLGIRMLNLAAPARFPFSIHTTPDYTNHPAANYIRE